MKLKTLIILGLIVIALGAWLAYSRGMFGKEMMKNAEMLDTKNETAITVEDNVEYFPGAKGYFVRPEAEGNYPGVVMIHENRGLRPEIRETAKQLAKEGYMVLAVDLLGSVVETQEEARALTAKFDQKTGIENMKAAVAYLKGKGAKKIASLGWCFGGKQSIELAISGEPLDATVVYYGGGMATTTEKLAPIKWPVLGIFGDKDQVIPVNTVKAFEESLNKLSVPNEIYIYPGVGHAFANPSGMNYAARETKDAWGKTIAFLKAYLAPTEIPLESSGPESFTYRLESFNGTEIPRSYNYRLSFDGDEISAKFCNSMSGQYVVEEGKMKANLISTKMYCGEPANLMEIENTFGSILRNGAAFSYEGQKFTLLGGGGEKMVFQKEIQ